MTAGQSRFLNRLAQSKQENKGNIYRNITKKNSAKDGVGKFIAVFFLS